MPDGSHSWEVSDSGSGLILWSAHRNFICFHILFQWKIGNCSVFSVISFLWVQSMIWEVTLVWRKIMESCYLKWYLLCRMELCASLSVILTWMELLTVGMNQEFWRYPNEFLLKLIRDMSFRFHLHFFHFYVLQEIMQHKLVFIETQDVVETTLALDNYRRACDCGRGAVFFSVAR